MKKISNDLINNDRRRFLKILALGGGLFAVGKIYNILIQNRVISETDFKNLKVTETGKEVKFAEPDGEEILVIDKDGF